MIEADLRELEKMFGVKVDWTSFDEAFTLRDKYSQAMIPSAIDSYIIQNAETTLQKRLAKMAKSHYQAEIEKFSIKLKKYEQDVKDFETKLKSGSKIKDLEEKLRKRRETVQWHKEKIEYYKKIEETGAPRVFPNFYTPVVVKDDISPFHPRLLKTAAKKVARRVGPHVAKVGGPPSEEGQGAQGIGNAPPGGEVGSMGSFREEV